MAVVSRRLLNHISLFLSGALIVVCLIAIWSAFSDKSASIQLEYSLHQIPRKFAGLSRSSVRQNNRGAGGSDHEPAVEVPVGMVAGQGTLPTQNRSRGKTRNSAQATVEVAIGKVARHGTGTIPENIEKQPMHNLSWRLYALEDKLFTSDVGPLSDSDCLAINPKAPVNLGRDNLVWICNFSKTFVFQDRDRRALDVRCNGTFKVNFVDREENDSPRDNGKFTNNPVYEEYTGPTILPFQSKYADVVCNGQHNYRTQLVPNPELEVKQRVLYDQLVKDKELKPLSILSISIDSVSRAQMHRSFGLPKTVALLKRLYYASVRKDTRSSPLTHRSFLFNRVNSIGGYTAMNLVAMYAGELFTEQDERERVKHSKFPRPVKEWIWQYAAQHGYITSYAADTGNGLFGTRTVCKDCHYRPGCLPHWEHGWVKKENTQFRDGVFSGFCEGDLMVFDYIMNYSRQVLQRDHPAKWVAFDANEHHRPESESINQIDTSLVTFLENVLKENSELVVFLFGDHGKPYSQFHEHLGGHYETLLPFFSIILPLSVLVRRPDFGYNLLENSQRLISYFDVHTTAKSLMHFPHMESVEGHLSHEGINLLTHVISPHRTCRQAGIPDWSCACHATKEIPEKEWPSDVQQLVDKAVKDINKQHKTEEIVSSENRTTCQDVHFDKFHSVFSSTGFGTNLNAEGKLERKVELTIDFSVIQGPARFKLVAVKDRIVSLKQMTRYAKYEECFDQRVSMEFCICKNFPIGTP